MTVSHSTAVRTILADAATATIGTSGLLRFYTSGDVLLCTINLSSTAFGAAVSGVSTLADTPLEGTCVAGGTCTKFSFLTSGATAVINGSVGTSGADINLTQVTFSINDVIRLTGLTYSAPT